MSFTNKPSVALTLDQVMEIVDQLSPADTLKVAKMGGAWPQRQSCSSVFHHHAAATPTNPVHQ